MNLIDVDRLRAEIEGWYNAYKIGTHGVFRSGKVEALRETIELINSLQQEQPEVDLKKEIDNFLNETGAPYVWCNDDEQKEWCNIIAHHFYELGLNARKDK